MVVFVVSSLEISFLSFEAPLATVHDHPPCAATI